jgi:hypothetical protein
VEDVGFTVIWYVLWSFGIFCGHSVCFVVIWFILPSFGTFSPLFGIFYQEKSGNPCARKGFRLSID